MTAALHQIEAEIADEDAPLSIDDHVVDGAGRDARRSHNVDTLPFATVSSLRSNIEVMTGLPSGRNPRPPAMPGIAHTVSHTPSSEARINFIARLSTNHNLPSCQRGPSKYFPSVMSGCQFGVFHVDLPDWV